MNLRRTWTVLLACGAAALLAAPPVASAKPGFVVIPGYRSAELDLEGSNGYRIYIERRGHRKVFLLAAGGRNTVAYVARSLAPKGSGIKARLPGVGWISVRFRPQGPPQREKPLRFPGCKSKEIVEQPGWFVGAIRIRGERGYTRVRRKRAPGTIKTVGKEVCKRSTLAVGPESDSGGIELRAVSDSAGFDASAIPELTSTAVFSAGTSERRRGMEIYRSTFVHGKKKDLLLGDTRPFPLSATVTPPAPFQGSAEYRRTPEGERTWTGSLTVLLPGLGPVALTGPDFSARLCQHSGCTGSSIDGHSLPWIVPGHERLRLP